MPVTNPGPIKPPELQPHLLRPCWGCGGFGHIVANCPQPPKWYPCESSDVYVCDDLYVYDAVHVPDLLTSNNMGGVIDSQSAVNKEDLVTESATDLIAGPSHLYYHHVQGVDRLSKCVAHSKADGGHQQVGCIPCNEIFSQDPLMKGYPML